MAAMLSQKNDMINFDTHTFNIYMYWNWKSMTNMSAILCPPAPLPKNTVRNLIALIIYIFSPRNYIYTCFLYYIFAVFIFVYLHNAFLVSWTWLKSQPIHYIKTQICFNIRRTVYSDKPSYSRSVQNYVIIQGLSITCQNIQTFAQVRTEWITNRTMFIQWNLPLSVLQVIERHFFWIIYQIVLQNISLAMPELSSVPYTGTYLCRTYYF